MYCLIPEYVNFIDFSRLLKWRVYLMLVDVQSGIDIDLIGLGSSAINEVSELFPGKQIAP